MVVQLGILAEAGVMVIDTSSAGVTVRVLALEVIPERVAVMVVVPCARDKAMPLEPAALLIVAILVFEECHVTDEVISCVVLPE